MATKKSTVGRSVAPDPEALIAAPKSAIGFSTEARSPFDDGYSIAGEESVLAGFLAGSMDESDPLYERYLELEERKDRLAKMQAQFQTRKGSDQQVKPAEYFAMDELGRLVDSEDDTMTLHTKEAFRLFMGRGREPGSEVAPIVGGRRIASSLRNLWILTANDNPYADWALLRHEQSIGEVEERLRSEIKDAEALLHRQHDRGLSFSVLKSAEPQALQLGFRSPYGYAISRLIVDYDYFVRLQKTLARKTLRSDAQMRQTIAELTRFVRRIFNETGRFDRWLARSEIHGLTRLDFIVEYATEEANKRVEFVKEVFGMVPADVFTAKMQPRHSRRRYSLTEHERRLLQSVGVEMSKAEAMAVLGQEAESGLV
ncbi:TIGR03761 family integrating conjugative element protein [Diaphorobacter sp. HDW4B]|uniref:PFL_4669 family integrating conjugative element protein n=1 Tax=Diaphorobacter sp. HDW4B TaxID=2714925 RepID=UPI001409AA42|nr:TIGR03761 family integrating conjugative element protein [Diaphorobacter sp. HDW4B]QIL73095.1 TIGR03761 family integrating conjugative element protein [Diaphorobacter sp. HDW4B]